MTSLRQRMLEDMQVRNLSPHTQTLYVQQVARFARHFRQSPECLGLVSSSDSTFPSLFAASAERVVGRIG